jgi:lipoprotein-anchoring transpeptidase ErfK/SrfK
MARHPLGARAGQKARNQTYTIIVVVLIIAVAIAFYYGPFGKNEAEPIDDPNMSTGPETLAVHRTGTNPDSSPQVADSNTVKMDVNNPEPAVPEANDVVALRPPADTVPRQEASSTREPSRTEPNLPAPGAGSPAPGTVPSLVRQTNPEQPVVPPGDEVTTLIAEAEKLIATGTSGMIAARDKLNEALRMPMSPTQRSSVKDRLGNLSERWLFSRTVVPNDPLCESYLVKRGENLELIGHKYRVPYEIIMQINKITRPELLQAGSTIKVINGPFHAKVYRSTFTMDLYLQNTYVRSFKVGLGKPGMETPTGLWRVKPGGKLERPIWTNPIDNKTYHPEDPDYPLGSRWIALEGLSGEAKERTGFAIHGTKEPDQIGTAGSQGCIRMHNGEAILVYNLLAPTYSQVEVTD